VDKRGEYVQLCIEILNFFNYAPIQRRGAYSFAHVGWSVDQTMSAQYLENFSLDCNDISYVVW
jgi:hypothetical protein